MELLQADARGGADLFRGRAGLGQSGVVEGRVAKVQRRQKKVTEMLKALKTGDKVITNGGIYGTIVGLEDEAVQLRVAEQVKMKVARSAIAGLQAEPPKES